MTLPLTLSDIENSIPHRYENLLLDSVERPLSEDMIKGRLFLHIEPGDALGRDIFFETTGRRTLFSPLYMEILALGSIVNGGKVPDDSLIFYVGISNFKKESDLLLGDRIVGEVEQLKNKGPFLRYSGKLSVGSRLVTSGDMMAVMIPKSKGKEKDLESKPADIDLPTPNQSISIDKSIWGRSPHLVALDHLVYSGPSSCLGLYTYRSNHPFTRGHFPTNPVMMGVMQWMSFEDVLTTYICHLPKDHPFRLAKKIKAQGVILKSDRSIACEGKDLVFEVHPDPHAFPVYTCIEAKKVSFRDMVLPEEPLSIYLTDISAE